MAFHSGSGFGGAADGVPVTQSTPTKRGEPSSGSPSGLSGHAPDPCDGHATGIRAGGPVVNGQGVHTPSPETTAPLAQAKRQGKKNLNTVKTPKFNGSSAIKSHKAQMDNLAEYLGWTERDRVFYLKNSLKKPADQVIWELSPTATESEIYDALRTRYGTANQTVTEQAQEAW